MPIPSRSPTASPSNQKVGSSTSTCSRPTLIVKLIAGRGFEPLIVDVAGDVLDPAAPDAEHRFDLPSDSKIPVIISVPRPVWAVYSPAGELLKRFRPASETEGETEKIEAQIEKDAHGGYALARPHPRLTLVTTSASGGTPACVRLDVDLRFLRVTQYFRKSYPFPMHRTGTELEVGLEQLDPGINDPDAKQVRYRSKDARVELFELTTGDSPKLWCVVWRHAMALVAEYQTSVFFMPKGDAYKNAGEAHFMRLKRYLLTPGRPQPFFIWAPVENTQLQKASTVNLAKPVVDRDDGSKPPLANECRFEDSAISCALIDQLVESGERVLLVLPMPNGEGAGAWGPIVTKPGWLTQHLDALQRAVHTVRKEWPRTVKDDATKASVGGFSAGAQPAYLALSLNPKRFNGFFWFDVPESDARQHKWLQSWIDGDSSRKVWLIGGFHYDALSTVKINIDRSSNVKLLPARASHYTADGTAYSKAISEPPACPGWTTLVLEPLPVTKEGSVFAATGVFGDVALPTLLKAESKGTPLTVVSSPTRASTSEALGLLVFGWRRDHTMPIREEAELKKLTRYVDAQVYPLRHSWTAFGGEVFGERGSGFVSFFGACLRDWAP